MRIEKLIDEFLDPEGGYVNHPADRGGPTHFGITEAVARAHGFEGLMRNDAAAIYTRLYWLRPGFDAIDGRSPRIAAEVFDTGVNMGPAVATTFLQRALTALNRNGRDYADLTPDGRIGPARSPRSTLFSGFAEKRAGNRAASRARSSAGRTTYASRRATTRQ